MKKYLKLVVFLLLSYSGSSQGLQPAGIAQQRGGKEDSTKIPNVQLKEALKLIEQGELCERIGIIKDRQISILQMRIDIKDSMLYTLNERILIADNIRKTYESDALIYTTEINTLKRSLKTQKRKTRTSKLGMVAIAALATFIIIKF